MALTITHPYVSTIAEGTKSGTPGGEVGPVEWNATHTVSGTIGDNLTFYVNGSTGIDSNDGLTTATAWKTITKVNASTFSPGVSILFAGGQTFSGAIVSPSAGTPAAPITFGSYGGGQATISSGNSSGFTSTNQAGIIVRDLTFTGSASSNTGISFNNSLAGSVHLQNIQIINCNVTGYGFSGISIYGSNASAGYDDVLIEGCSTNSCCNSTGSGIGSSGIQVLSAGYGLNVNAPSFNNVIISNCFAASNPGVSDTVVTGYGISLGQILNGRVEGCVTNGNGANGTTVSLGGPLGLLVRDSINVLIASCVSYGNLSPTANDAGGGFDLDAGCYYCTIRDCYSYSNFGPGYLVCSIAGDTSVLANDHCNIINCVSENDGGGSGSLAHASLVLEDSAGTITHFRAYGCTFFQSLSGTDVVYIFGAGDASTTGSIIGNRFIASDTQPFIYCAKAPSIVFESNSYFSGHSSGNSFQATWNNVGYTDKMTFIGTTGLDRYSELITAGDFLNIGGNYAGGSGILIENTSTGGHLFSYTAVGSSGVFGLSAGAGILIDLSNGNSIFSWDTSGNVAYTADIRWAAQSPYSVGASDAGITRKGAAALKVTNGSSGYGSIDASGYSASGTAGISATITTAKLTPTTGTNGSMTFVNGILTAQTQAT